MERTPVGSGARIPVPFLGLELACIPFRNANLSDLAKAARKRAVPTTPLSDATVSHSLFPLSRLRSVIFPLLEIVSETKMHDARVVAE